MSDAAWKTKPLGELAFEVKDRVGQESEGLSVYGVDRHVGLTGETRYVAASLDRYKIIQPGMFAYNPMRLNIGSIGFCKPSYQRGLVSPDYIVFGCKPGQLNPEFLNYAIRGPEWVQWTSNAGVGSVRQRIYFKELARLPITVPPYDAQCAIVKVLQALDDKIESCLQIIKTLEKLAKTMFQSWFVNFDPVRSNNSKTKLIGIDSKTARHFPTAFQGSPLGPIPKGWEVSEIGHITDVVDCLHAKKPEKREVGKIYLQLNNIRDDGIVDISDAFLISEDDYQNWISRMEAKEGDCVITNVGRVGVAAQIPEGVKAALGRNMTGIRSKSIFPYPTFLIECLISEAMREEIRKKMDSGTILDALNVKNIPKLRFVRPPNTIANHFENLVRPVRQSMEKQLLESRTLAEMRDTLLPKLLSGELRVPAKLKEANA
ncbi:MAG: restriction endonuclease subunit S [Verrucomicrobiota bacterium]